MKITGTEWWFITASFSGSIVCVKSTYILRSKLRAMDNVYPAELLFMPTFGAINRTTRVLLDVGVIQISTVSPLVPRISARCSSISHTRASRLPWNENIVK